MNRGHLEFAVRAQPGMSPGSHTISLQAKLAQGVTATVNGDTNSALQGQLTVMILKKSLPRCRRG
jgi:hypothetical protein